MWSHVLQLTKIDIISLFNQIIEQTKKYDIGGWFENTYEFRDEQYFDSESFNTTAERQFDKILEELEDEENPIAEYLEFRNKILNKFELGSWYDIPKDISIRFRIETIDREDKKIRVRLKKRGVGEKVLSLNEEEFYNLLYQPQLFDLFGEE